MNTHFTEEFKQSKVVFEGYGSVFNIVDNVGDIILPGAFKNTLKSKKPIRLLWQHDYKHPIGNVLDIFEDTKGLYIKGLLLLDLFKGKEAYLLIKNHAICHLSIGYEVKDAFYSEDVRYIKEVDLWEVSIVTFAANPESRIKILYDTEDKILTSEIDKAIQILDH